MFDGFLDIFPLSLLWFALMASVTWAALQLYVGARLLGPLGICMAWAIYQVRKDGLGFRLGFIAGVRVYCARLLGPLGICMA